MLLLVKLWVSELAAVHKEGSHDVHLNLRFME